MNIFQRFSKNNGDKTKNLFNKSFFQFMGGTGSQYDHDAKTYVSKGYDINSSVYSIISQQASKTGSIPYYFKKIEDKNEAKSYQREIKSFNPNSPFSAQRLKRLEKKAFVSGEDFLDMPIPRPNVMQSWCEFYSMYKTFLKLNGNVYIYMLTPDNGANAGAPQAFYLLPSHLMEIVVKDDVNYLMVDESPVDHYVLIEGAQYSKFPYSRKNSAINTGASR